MIKNETEAEKIERFRNYSRKNYQKHSEAYKARAKAYYEANRDKRLEQMREYSRKRRAEETPKKEVKTINHYLASEELKKRVDRVVKNKLDACKYRPKTIEREEMAKINRLIDIDAMRTEALLIHYAEIIYRASELPKSMRDYIKSLVQPSLLIVIKEAIDRGEVG